MSNAREEPGAFHTVHPERDLESNWEVDVAKKLEEYLLKICSGDIPDDGHIPVNFAEAALLLQGSVQVYSRKVEYLYSLVLRALEFLSQKRQQDLLEGTPIQCEESDSCEVADDENDLFWGLDDVPVEAKNCLDGPTSKDAPLNHLVKPPANLVVLEGDCLDTTADGGELESYLLATSNLYQDFILLDPCDAIAVHEFLKGDKAGKGQNGTHRRSSARKSFQSPSRRSGGSARRSSLGKRQDADLNQSPWADCSLNVNNNNVGADPPACDNFDDNNCGFDMDDRYSEPRDLDDSDDDDNNPWKPLNPHEPGNLKVKPFRKVKAFKKNGVNSTKKVSITTLFPIATLHGTISPELSKIWEMQRHTLERRGESESPPLYEKLRQSLIDGEHKTFNAFCNPEDDNEECAYDNGIPDLGEPDFDLPENMYMDEDVPLHNAKHDDVAAHCDTNEAFGHEDPNTHASLEDLCRSHLDALLASIAETEKHTELASRVLTWKQKIEHNLEEQESHPPFDIHNYGERIIDKLSLDAHNGNSVCFADVVKGQEKYDVARSFSALLQLVNNGDVDLDRSGLDGKSICYTAVNPFHVRLLHHDRNHGEIKLRVSKKRVKSPSEKECSKSDRDKSGKEKSPIVRSYCSKSDRDKSGKENSPIVRSSSREDRSRNMLPQPNCKFSVKLGTIGGVRCTPEGKRRRRSRFIEPVDLHSPG